MGSGFLKRKKEARAMQEQFMQMRAKMEALEVEGTAGGGLVTITLTGDNMMKQIRIKPECVDPEDVDGLQDLIKAAYMDAQKKLEAQGMPGMPGMEGLKDLGF
jgi:DNA-binding YbaB/EbfC family protein